MTPARIAELRRVGVLDGTKADDARIALLDRFGRVQSEMAHIGCSPDITTANMGLELHWLFDPLMADTAHGKAMRWARAQQRRRWRAELRAAGWTTRPRDGAWIDPSRDRRRPAFPFTLDGALGVHRARRRP